jgi:surface antigen
MASPQVTTSRFEVYGSILGVSIEARMSALGHKKTFAAQNAMSVFPSIADMKWQFATCDA